MAKGTQEKVDPTAFDETKLLKMLSKGKKLQHQESEAFNVLREHFFVKSARREEDNHVLLEVEPKPLAQAFEQFTIAQAQVYGHYADSLHDLRKVLSGKKRGKFLNSKVSLGMLLQLATTLYEEGCVTQVMNCLMMYLLGTLTFSMLSESNDLSNFTEQMKPFLPVMKKLQESLAGAPEFFDAIWRSQIKRGALI